MAARKFIYITATSFLADKEYAKRQTRNEILCRNCCVPPSLVQYLYSTLCIASHLALYNKFQCPAGKE